ncbi:helix-turn-helix domain-containing protein [Salinifilum ghardaiensis]
MPEPATSSAPVVAAARFVTAHAAEPLRLGDVADHVGYSPHHLARTFERAVGQPPGRFLAAHRFQRAKELLLSGGDRVLDVCLAVGFDSPGTFTSRFTRVVGTTPTAFRRLPEQLTENPREPVHRPGRARRGATVTGAVALPPAASARLPGAVIYVGLFGQRSPSGVPVAGSLLDRPGSFTLTGVPPGEYWLLGTALPAAADPRAHLAPAQQAVGQCPHPVRARAQQVSTGHAVSLDIALEWAPPVLVALPPLAARTPQNRRRPTAAAGTTVAALAPSGTAAHDAEEQA